MNCSKCGNPLNDGAVFCPKCGSEVERPAAPVAPVNPAAPSAAPVAAPAATGGKKKSPAGKFVLIAVVVLLVLVCAGLLLSHYFLWGGGSELADDLPAGNFEPSDTAALSELLGYIDQGEAVAKQVSADFNALDATDNGTPQQRFRQKANIMQTGRDQLEPKRDAVSNLQGLDPTVRDAGVEYFNMQIGRMQSWYEVCDFMSNFFKAFDVIVARPTEASYDGDVQTYYNDLDTWYQSVTAAMDSIASYPSCVESAWTHYKGVTDLNQSIVEKEYYAYALNDWLRHYSAKYMSNRYETFEENAYKKMLDSLAGETDFARKQYSIASKLADEIHAYADMEESQREGYAFAYNQANEIALNYEPIKTIYPSLYNTYDAFVILKTGCYSGTRKIVVEAEIPGLTQKYKQSFNLDASYKAIYVKPAPLAGDLNLSAAKTAQLNISVYESDGTTLIDSKTFPVDIKSRNDVDWYTEEYGIATQDNILSFLTPEAKAISALKRTAIDELSAMTGGGMGSFPGYQELDSEGYLSNHYVVTYLQAAGIMRALNETGVRYNMDSFSISGSNQHVLLPEEVLEQRSGLCVETALTVASALQSADMHTFLVFPPGHAQVAVETWRGSGEYFLVETTALEDSQNSRQIFINGANQLLYGEPPSGPITYYNSAGWANLLANSIQYIVDCDDSRVLGLTPFAN